uniref:Ammonium transporter n=1 Tax=Acrobeloides nanus TaxID=290746 RepID=A0A914CAS3_9BILA
MATIIFLMQAGFAFLEAGAVRSKNCTNILLMKVLESLITGIGYWAVGWGLAYGDNKNVKLEPFFGGSEFFLMGTTDYARWFFQYVFAATAATIISGAVAERITFYTYIIYSVFISCVVYPIITHWGWSEHGWMKHGIQTNYISVSYTDFAGSGMVHLLGGTIALVGALVIGPRIGKFPQFHGEQCVEIKGHSVPLSVLGGLILMFGFLAFTGGSTGQISSPGIGQVCAKAMVNTILCAAWSVIAVLVIQKKRTGKLGMLHAINGCLCGMISAAAGANQIYPWACSITGLGAGLSYLTFIELAKKLKVDDPLDAFALHVGGGIWGLVAVCIVGEKGIFYGIFYPEHTSFLNSLALLGWNMCCALVIIIFALATSFPLFYICKNLGILRVPIEAEIKGLDIYNHGEDAYPLVAYKNEWEEIKFQEELEKMIQALIQQEALDQQETGSINSQQNHKDSFATLESTSIDHELTHRRQNGHCVT